MKLVNEFHVAAPLERTWQTMLDVQRTAGCLPGATVEPSDEHGVYRGRMKVKVGAVTSEYSGSARISEIDADAHVAVFDVRGRELRGQGSAAATIVNRLAPMNGGTGVTVETDLHISGRAAEFGRGLIADVSSRMLDEFARGLEREILRDPRDGPADGGQAAGDDDVTRRPATDDVFDVGALAWLPLVKRVAPLLAAGLVLALAARPRRHRRLRVSFELQL